ncbi:RDD family protein [Streptomyces sp. NPDC002553]|uniref:RDD family protein n=1 Tax=Streptomyces sp. NPDC002553 TaxID=3154417 RepID=UPI0033173606
MIENHSTRGKQQLARGVTAAPSVGRRLAAVSLDALIALVGGFVTGTALARDTAGQGAAAPLLPSPLFWATTLGAALTLSFANHVLLTLMRKGSLGKLTSGLRVVRASDGGHAGFVRLVGRWLFGIYWSIFCIPLHVATDSGVEQQDAVGLHIVRRT